MSIRKTCRSELARDGFKSTAFNQNARVIVNDHREQARSYSDELCYLRVCWTQAKSNIRVRPITINNRLIDGIYEGLIFF